MLRPYARQTFRLVRRARDAKRVRRVDERTHDENALVASDGFADRGIRLFASGAAAHKRFDRNTSRRLFSNHGNVQIAVHDERERTRNRRGRHAQEMRDASVLARGHDERLALVYAKTMLLVHDSEREVRRESSGLEQRMRPDENRVSPIDGFHQRSCIQFLFIMLIKQALVRSSDEDESCGMTGQNPSQAFRMLLGENVRGRKQGARPSGVLHMRHQKRGHGRFPRPDVALQKPTHRLLRLTARGGPAFGGHIFQRRPDGALLIAGEIKRQTFHERFRKRFVERDRRRAVRIRFATRETQRDLVGEHFPIPEHPPPLLRVLRRFRSMDLPQSVHEGFRLIGRVQADRVLREIFNRIRHQSSIGLLSQGSGQTVHGRKFACGERFFFRRFP